MYAQNPNVFVAGDLLWYPVKRAIHEKNQENLHKTQENLAIIVQEKEKLAEKLRQLEINFEKFEF